MEFDINHSTFADCKLLVLTGASLQERCAWVLAAGQDPLAVPRRSGANDMWLTRDFLFSYRSDFDYPNRPTPFTKLVPIVGGEPHILPFLLTGFAVSPIRHGQGGVVFETTPDPAGTLAYLRADRQLIRADSPPLFDLAADPANNQLRCLSCSEDVCMLQTRKLDTLETISADQWSCDLQRCTDFCVSGSKGDVFYGRVDDNGALIPHLRQNGHIHILNGHLIDHQRAHFSSDGAYLAYFDLVHNLSTWSQTVALVILHVPSMTECFRYTIDDVGAMPHPVDPCWVGHTLWFAADCNVQNELLAFDVIAQSTRTILRAPSITKLDVWHDMGDT